MKIQFILAGWHFDQIPTYDGLKELSNNNESINVFWSCHREPTDYIKNNFNYKVFFNGGEECGAYDQAIDYLNLDDNTVCFFLHDDLIVKNWEFIYMCIDRLNKGYKVVGNGRDYNDNFDPFKTTKIGIKEKFDGATFRDYVKEENQYLFDSVLPIVKVRPSFICMKYSDVKSIGGFEPSKEAYTPPLTTADEWCPTDEPHYRGTKGIGSFGNLFPALVCYKMNKVLGTQNITWLSNSYVDSEFIYECQRGNITDVHPMS